MVKCPTSEFPICPSGSPTERPDVSRVVPGYSLKSRVRLGVLASAMALPSFLGFIPHPSRTMRHTFFTPNPSLIPSGQIFCLFQTPFLDFRRGGLRVRRVYAFLLARPYVRNRKIF